MVAWARDAGRLVVAGRGPGGGVSSGRRAAAQPGCAGKTTEEGGASAGMGWGKELG